MSTLQSIPAEDSLTPSNEHHAIVRERVFSPSEFEHVLLMVHEERLTGTVTLDLNQGGLCAIRVNEKQSIKKGDHS